MINKQVNRISKASVAPNNLKTKHGQTALVPSISPPLGRHQARRKDSSQDMRTDGSPPPPDRKFFPPMVCGGDGGRALSSFLTAQSRRAGDGWPEGRELLPAHGTHPGLLPALLASARPEPSHQMTLS